MLNPIQQKRLLQVEADLKEVCFERMRYTHDTSKHGIEEWDRLWKRRGELSDELERLKVLRDSNN